MKTNKTKHLPFIAASCLLLMLALVSCVSPDGQTAAILEPMTIPNPTYAPERIPAIPVEEQEASQPDTEDNTAVDPIAEVKGLPIYAPAPYEPHLSDMQYFYMFGHDYIIYKFSLEEGRNVLWRDYDASTYGSATQYVAVFFRYFKARDIEVADYFIKIVFENDECAQRFANDHSEWELIAVGNIVYQMYPPLEWGSEGRERIVWEINDIDDAEVLYVSKP